MAVLLRPALSLLVLLSALTGVLYPLLVTAIATALFPDQAHGSLVLRDGRVVGSRLIGQAFSDTKYFWSRPSATGGWPNNALASGGANLSPLNPALLDAATARAAALRAADPGNHAPLPLDLVTSAASGLDPDISSAAARYQAARVAAARGMASAELERLIGSHTRRADLGFLGEPRVNVLELNLALDAAQR